ncbi:DUF4352 domain-containing protein [Haloarcula laminariae]|uniref:DUF4352 domain-containing protein n=1 Tax=Haloarcula laminariae TaxID=2961577 RepID=UPI0021CA1621|nr:DUF4352 domain-containing protein [Halomicroarcula laminariae]
MTDRSRCTDDTHTFGGSRRRYLAALLALAGGAPLAGCASESGSSPASETPAATDAATAPTGTRSTGGTDGPALGDVVEDDRLAVVAYSVGRSADFESLEVLNGDGHVVVEMGVKNTHGSEYVGVSSRGGFTLRDADGTEYHPTVAGPEPRLDAGALAPGEAARGFVTFDRVPADATGFSVDVAPTAGPGDLGRATIDLESDGEGRTLTHDFAVPVHDLGDTTEYRDTRFTADAVRTSTGDGAVTPRPGHEFVVVDITVENTADDELFVNTPVQADLKDTAGRTYDLSTDAILAFEDVAASVTVDPESSVHTALGFEVEAGLEPLYLVVDLDSIWVGGRTFYRLR